MIPKGFDKIIDQAHKDGIKFTFDSDCDVLNCQNVSEWNQTITHPTEGKMILNLCQKHQDDFDKDISFQVVKHVKKSNGEAVQK